MNIMARLAARHLRMNRKRTIITVVGIALSIGMVTAITGMIVSFQDMVYHDAVARDGLWHVRYMWMEQETAEQVLEEPIFQEGRIFEGDQGLTVELQFVRLHKGIFDESEAVCHKYGIGQKQVRYHNDLLVSRGIIPGSYFDAVYSFAAVLIALVAIASIMVINNAFSISASERSKQFGLLASVGATRRQIRSTVLAEGLVLAVFAIPLGIVIGLVAEWVALSIANYILGGMDAVNFLARFRVVVSPLMLLAAVVAAFITIFLSAWFPARRAAKVSPVEAIRQTQTIKIRPRSVRVSPLTGKLFGFEGTLAAKTMKRNRGRYRTTVISLVVSIVLFIGVSSFGELLMKAAGMVYEDYGSNVLVLLHGEDKDRQDRLAAEMAAWPEVDSARFRELRGSAMLPDELLTNTSRETWGAGAYTAVAFSYPAEDFAALCAQMKLDSADYTDPAAPRAILINATGTYINQGQRMSFTPYNIPAGSQVSMGFGEGERALTIGAELREVPAGLSVVYSAKALNLIVSEEVRAALNPADRSDYLQMAVMVTNPYAFEKKATAFLAGEMEQNTYSVLNFEEAVANNRNIGVLVMTFVYGFIALLSLIGVTNVITTISTSIALRRREFAMLRSVGMNQPGLGKILRYESMIYGAKSLVLGIPLGLAASVLMYRALGLAMSFAYIFPLTSVLISIAAVAVLAFATTWFAARRQRRDTIVGALQDEVV